MFNIFITTTSNKIKCFHAYSFEIRDDVLTITLRSKGQNCIYPEIKQIKMYRIKHMCFERATEELK